MADESSSLRDHRGNEIVMLVLFALPQSRGRLVDLDKASARLSSRKVKSLAVPREVHQAAELNMGFKSLSFVSNGSRELFDPTRCCAGVLPSRVLFRIRLSRLIWNSLSIARAMCARVGSAGRTRLDKMKNLRREIDRLNEEKPVAAAPDDHVH